MNKKTFSLSWEATALFACTVLLYTCAYESIE